MLLHSSLSAASRGANVFIARVRVYLQPVSALKSPQQLFTTLTNLSTVSRGYSSTTTSTTELEMTPKRSQQYTNRVMMVRPGRFNCNPQTMVDNVFQRKSLDGQEFDVHKIQELALKEFTSLTDRLKEAKIDVTIVDDDLKESSDAIFPNNWISFHGISSQDNAKAAKVALYPMKTVNRRLERRPWIIDMWKDKLGAEVVDYSSYEEKDKFLEGTGSMILDRDNGIVYTCDSLRTDRAVLEHFCHDFNYRPIVFKALSKAANGAQSPIYHTNVMMSVGDTFAIVCLECIVDTTERESVRKSLEETKKEIIAISLDQVNKFAGNGLLLGGTDGRRCFVMSTRAHGAFTSDQLAVIGRHVDDIIHVDLNTIETLGGGGARCMIAEVFPAKY